MKINISGKNMDIGIAFQEYVEEKLEKSAKNYLNNITWADVILSKKSHLFHTDIILHEGKNLTVKASFESDEVYNSFDIALAKIEKQLRKYHSKIASMNRKNARETEEPDLDQVIKGTKYVISREENSENDNPITIAEKATNIEKLTVSEAIMKMDLNNLPALLFKNAANGRLNVVYHRIDGNISWVDPQE